MTEPDVLDTAQELQSLQKTLRESGRKLLFRAEVATVRNFRFLVRGCVGVLGDKGMVDWRTTGVKVG